MASHHLHFTFKGLTPWLWPPSSLDGTGLDYCNNPLTASTFAHCVSFLGLPHQSIINGCLSTTDTLSQFLWPKVSNQKFSRVGSFWGLWKTVCLSQPLLVASNLWPSLACRYIISISVCIPKVFFLPVCVCLHIAVFPLCVSVCPNPPPLIRTSVSGLGPTLIEYDFILYFLNPHLRTCFIVFFFFNRNRNIDVREKHQLFASSICPDWGSYMLRPGIKPTT